MPICQEVRIVQVQACEKVQVIADSHQRMQN